MSHVFLYMIYYQLNIFSIIHAYYNIILTLRLFFISSYNNIWTYFIILYYRLPGRDTKSVQSIQNMEVNFIKLFFHTMPVICDSFLYDVFYCHFWWTNEFKNIWWNKKIEIKKVFNCIYCISWSHNLHKIGLILKHCMILPLQC